MWLLISSIIQRAKSFKYCTDYVENLHLLKHKYSSKKFTFQSSKGDVTQKASKTSTPRYSQSEIQKVKEEEQKLRKKQEMKKYVPVSKLLQLNWNINKAKHQSCFYAPAIWRMVEGH